MKNCPSHIRKQAEDWLDNHGFHRGFENVTPAPESTERFPRHT
jgi:hypothetical protein